MHPTFSGEKPEHGEKGNVGREWTEPRFVRANLSEANLDEADLASRKISKRSLD
jgi:uncharacterized protein YjbI with pentapeptide repeats